MKKIFITGTLLFVIFGIKSSLVHADTCFSFPMCDKQNNLGTFNSCLPTELSYTICPNGCDTQTSQCNPAPSQTSPTVKAGPLEYAPLEPLPFIPYTKDQNNNVVYSGNSADLINGYFKILLSIGSVLAVVMIVWYGISYMTSDIGGKKAQAKTRIQSALLGLFLLLGAWIILNTINPKLLNVTLILPHLTSQNTNTSQNTTPAAGGQTCGSSLCYYGNNNWITAAIVANQTAMEACLPGSLLPYCQALYSLAVTADNAAKTQFHGDMDECTFTQNGFGGTAWQLEDINGNCDSIKGKGYIIVGNQKITFTGCLDIPNPASGWKKFALPYTPSEIPTAPTPESYPWVCIYNQ